MTIRHPLAQCYFQNTEDVMGQHYLYFADAEQKQRKIKP